MTLEIEEVETDLTPCNDCGDEVAEGDLHETGNGDEVCDDCLHDNYSTCEDCGSVVPDDEYRMVSNSSYGVCESCLDNYYSCADCDEYVHGDDTRGTLHDESVCERCCDNNYSYCDNCEGYYHHDFGGDHEHDEDCDCEAPRQSFRIPNGSEMLANDERTSIALPAGFLSDEGVGEIARLIRDNAPRPEIVDGSYENESYKVYNDWQRLSYTFTDIGSEWQSKDGNYPKRLSRHAYKEYGIKVPANILSEVGNIGRAHSNGIDHEVEITRNLNLPASEFAHEDSCWWQSYSSSRCALKSNGGFGLRTFGTVEYPEYGYVHGPWRNSLTMWKQTGTTAAHDTVTGRAWVMPLRFDADRSRFTPTFETETPDAYVVFNGYGDLNGYAAARIMGQLTGMTYRKVGFDADPMYVNSDAGYLVAPEEIAGKFTDGRIGLNTPQHSSLAYTETNIRETVNV